jgi:hypothetical protein
MAPSKDRSGRGEQVPLSQEATSPQGTSPETKPETGDMTPAEWRDLGRTLGELLSRSEEVNGQGSSSSEADTPEH